MPFTTLSRPEHIDDISVPSASAFNTVQTLPSQGGQLPSDRFIGALALQFEGRATMPAAGGPTGVRADAPESILDRVQVAGYHRIRKQDELFFDLRGPDIRQLTRLYIANAPFRVPATLSVAGSAVNDIRFFILLPFTPLRMPPQTQLGWLLDAPNYDRLILKLKIGDSASLFSGGGTAPTWTAFGSASGNPRVRVHGYFAMGGGRQFGGFVPGRVWRYFIEKVGSLMTTTATQQRIIDIPRGHRMRAMLLKTGVKGTTVTAGNDAFDTLSDTILANLEINRGTNNVVRKYTDFFGIQFEHSVHQQIQPDVGYAMVDFAKAGLVGESFDARSLVSGPTGNVDLFLKADVTGAANQATLAMFEELHGAPGSLAIMQRRLR